MTVKVEGLKELQRRMRALPGNVQTRVMRTATIAGARVIVKDAKTNIPIRQGGKLKAITPGGRKGYRYPGYLKKNIGARRNKRVPKWTISYLVKPIRFAYYGAFLEFGTSTQAARPWLRPALEAGKPKVYAVIRERALKGIDRQIEKLRRSIK